MTVITDTQIWHSFKLLFWYSNAEILRKRTVNISGHLVLCTSMSIMIHAFLLNCIIALKYYLTIFGKACKNSVKVDFKYYLTHQLLFFVVILDVDFTNEEQLPIGFIT